MGLTKFLAALCCGAFMSVAAIGRLHEFSMVAATDHCVKSGVVMALVCEFITP